MTNLDKMGVVNGKGQADIFPIEEKMHSII